MLSCNVGIVMKIHLMGNLAFGHSNFFKVSTSNFNLCLIGCFSQLVVIKEISLPRN